MRLALADAFNLRRVQAENPQVCLGRCAFEATQVLVLGLDAAGQHEGMREELFQSLVALDPAPNVADDAAEKGLQRLQ